MRERSVGLGVMGYHSFLQALNVPFESVVAKVWNTRMFKHIRAQADTASRLPAEDPAPAPVAQAVEAEISPAPAAPTPPTTVAESPAPLPVAPAPPPLELPAAALAPASPARPIAAPEPALQELGRFGPMPRVGDDGRTSIRTYAGQFDRQDSRPRIGIIVADIGISATQTDDAIRRLPPAMTLVISPYAPVSYTHLRAHET